MANEEKKKNTIVLAHAFCKHSKPDGLGNESKTMH